MVRKMMVGQVSGAVVFHNEWVLVWSGGLDLGVCHPSGV